MVTTIASGNGANASRGVDSLTRREVQVLHKIADGVNLDHIADQLCLSKKTVAYHRRQLCEKLAAENDVQLAIIARSQGLTEIGALDDFSGEEA